MTHEGDHEQCCAGHDLLVAVPVAKVSCGRETKDLSYVGAIGY